MTLTGVSPVLLVADLDRAVVFWRDKLGFECETYGDPRDFATARRDGAIVLLALYEGDEKLVPYWRLVDKMWNAYVRTDDADALYAELQARDCPIDYTIYDAPSGFREFGVQDPDGHDIAFGQQRP
ncbi:MAG: VOC family protein [Gaiellaceae bacterium]